MKARQHEGWLIVWILCISLFFLWGAGYNTSGIFVTPLVHYFGWSRARVSLLFAMLALASGIIAPIAGLLIERVEARTVIAMGAAVSFTGLSMASMANSFAFMLVAYATLGIGLGLSTFVPASLVVSNWFDARRGLALGVVMGGQSLGGMVMAEVANYVVSSSGWRTADIILALPMLVVVSPLVLATVRTRPSVTIVDMTCDSTMGLEVRDALRARSFWMIAIAQFVYPFAISGPFVHLVAYLLGEGYSERAAALSLSILLGCAGFGQPLMGIVGDRIGGRRALALTFGVQATSLLLLLATKPFLLGIFVLAFGLTVSAPVALIPMVLAQSVGLKRFASLSGLIGFPFTIGLAAGPWVAGWIYDHTASYSPAFELSILMSALGIVVALFCTPLKDPTVPANVAMA